MKQASNSPVTFKTDKRFCLLSTGPGTNKLFPASPATLITSLRSLLLNNNEVGFENDYKDSHLHVLKGKCFTSA